MLLRHRLCQRLTLRNGQPSKYFISAVLKDVHKIYSEL